MYCKKSRTKRQPKHPQPAAACIPDRASKRRSLNTSSWADKRSHPSVGPPVQGPSKVGPAPSTEVYAVRWGSQQAVSPSPNTQNCLWQYACLWCAQVLQGPEAQNEGTIDGRSSSLCWVQNNCAAGGWQGATGWVGAERTSLVGGAWGGFSAALPLRQLAEGWCDQKDDQRIVLRGAGLLHVDRRCHQCATCPAASKRGPGCLTAAVVAVGGERALPPLRCYPTGTGASG